MFRLLIPVIFGLIYLYPLTHYVRAEDPFLKREEARGFSENQGITEDESDVGRGQAGRFPGYGATYRTTFGRMCKYLVSDSQVLRWNTAIDKFQKEKQSCIPCRQFYRSIRCKIPPDWSPSAKSAASMPATESLAAVSEAFQAIASDERILNQTVEALAPMLQELSVPVDHVTDSYYATLIAYIKAPLASSLDIEDARIEEAKKKSRKKQLETLF